MMFIGGLFHREEAIAACRKRIEIVANILGLDGFARIDAFVHADTGEVNLLIIFTVTTLVHLQKFTELESCV
jgi:hypothetical protein